MKLSGCLSHVNKLHREKSETVCWVEGPQWSYVTAALSQCTGFEMGGSKQCKTEVGDTACTFCQASKRGLLVKKRLQDF